VRRQYEYQDITTEQFRALAQQFLPKDSPDPKLEAFFEAWVYGTGIPRLRLAHSIKGKAPTVRLTGTVAQEDAPAEFSVWVPVQIQFSRGQALTQWVRTGAAPATFSLNLKQRPVKVLLDPANVVLKR
jgi:hypothetical protein